MSADSAPEPHDAHHAWGLLGWLALTFAASAGALVVSVDGWYAGLAKPTWNPPASLFGPVWTTLYVMMALAAWLIWREGGWRANRPALLLFLLQWALNAAWTPLFFGLHRPGLAFVEILALWGALLATIVAFWRKSPKAAALLIPYLLWVSFAAILNATIWRLNP